MRALLILYAQEGPGTVEFIFIILNFVTCIPVLLMVGGFRSVFPFKSRIGSQLTSSFQSIYHFWLLSGNTTTIEGWEKDKAATLMRRGKIREIKFPYVRDLSLYISSCLTRSCSTSDSAGTSTLFSAPIHYSGVGPPYRKAMA